MKITENNNEIDMFKEIYYGLFDSYRIIVKSKYQFVYDDFFEHLIADTNNYILKNNKEKNFDLIEHKIGIFKGLFYKHYSHSYFFYKILKPEENIEVNKELRKRKLKEIEDGSK